jgi:hypothetical protein
MSYHIEINEYQRRLIIKALTSTDVNQFSQAPGSGDAFDTEAKEFVCLVQMFGTLDLDDTAPGGGNRSACGRSWKSVRRVASRRRPGGRLRLKTSRCSPDGDVLEAAILLSVRILAGRDRKLSL